MLLFGRSMRPFTLLSISALFACSSGSKLGPPDPNVVSPYAGAHPIDEILHPMFVREGITYRRAPRDEICRRLMGDLLGRFPSKKELESECGDRSVEDIAHDFQSRDRYLWISERHWHDRLSPGETYMDWRDLKDLYARVDALHRGQVRYGDFARDVMSHPAFILSVDPPNQVRLAFQAFAGRPAADSETYRLAPLYSGWYANESPDPDFPYMIVYRMFWDPDACKYGGGCKTDLFGGAQVPSLDAGAPRAYRDMTPDERTSAQAFGALLTAQPFFWETAADEILDRLLGWSDGGRTPRRPGTVLPEVRDVLARWLETRGDYPGAERLVLTSWLYTAATEGVPENAPVYASGPVKPAPAEVWLDSLLAALGSDGEIGTCDVRYIGAYASYAITDAFEEGMIDEATMRRDLPRLHALMEDRRPLRAGEPIDDYEDLARSIGGCPLTVRERVAPSGVAFGYEQEVLANILCKAAFDGAADTDPATALRRQMPVMLGRDPTPEDVEDFSRAFASCGEPCADRPMSTVCVALAGSAEAMFY